MRRRRGRNPIRQQLLLRQHRGHPFGWWPTTLNIPTVCGTGGLVCPPGTTCVQSGNSNACVYPATTQPAVNLRSPPSTNPYRGGGVTYGVGVGNSGFAWR